MLTAGFCLAQQLTDLTLQILYEAIGQKVPQVMLEKEKSHRHREQPSQALTVDIPMKCAQTPVKHHIIEINLKLSTRNYMFFFVFFLVLPIL